MPTVVDIWISSHALQRIKEQCVEWIDPAWAEADRQTVAELVRDSKYSKKRFEHSNVKVRDSEEVWRNDEVCGYFVVSWETYDGKDRVAVVTFIHDKKIERGDKIAACYRRIKCR